MISIRILFVPLVFVSLAREAVSSPNIASNATDLQKRDTRLNTRKNYPIPYTHEIMFETTLFPVFTIEGKVNDQALRFTIDMCVDHPCLDIRAFQFSVQLNRRQVVRSHKIGRGQPWSNQETYGIMPFTRGKSFRMKITTDSEKYRVYVNDQFFCDYKHAVPLHTIKFIKIAESVKLNRFSEQIITPIAFDHRGPGQNATSLFLTKSLKTGDIIQHYVTVNPEIWRYGFIYFQLNLYEKTDNPVESKRHVGFLYRKNGQGTLTCSNTARQCYERIIATPANIFQPFTFSYEIFPTFVKVYFNEEYSNQQAVFDANLNMLFMFGCFLNHTLEYIPSP
ncbi:uncharacterized protein LOC131947249 [Physella acuta]|uniref:uncharacterized protein LOC131947249 n=1 Tax=Physella acuta TaxID=109671 RepID=UPI0027DC0600|nr:uncharacterized protein LOC131947249 [Physella acuta]